MIFQFDKSTKLKIKGYSFGVTKIKKAKIDEISIIFTNTRFEGDLLSKTKYCTALCILGYT